MNFKQIGINTAVASTIIAGSVIAASPAKALTFNFSGSPRSVAPSRTFTEGGITATATGTSTTPFFPSRNVFQSRKGLGVTYTKSNLENNQIDGLGFDETLNLAFSQKVNLNSATFSRVGRNDDFKLLVDGDKFIAADIPGGNIFDFGVGTFNFSPSPTGNLFGFTVAHRNDDYLLKSVDVTAVPTPALLPGLIGMGMTALRKKRKGEIA
jgi:hypothetical protein